MLVRLKIHSAATKCDAFHPKQQALLSTCCETEFDFTPGPYDPLPGN
jgi:hypothetical protein